MADLFSVTAPLLVTLPSGGQRMAVECFRHPQGALCFDPFWQLGDPDLTIYLLQGRVRGEGPWKVGDCAIRVLGCQATDGELAQRFSRWQSYLQEAGDAYPPRPLIEAIARKRGALIGGG